VWTGGEAAETRRDAPYRFAKNAGDRGDPVCVVWL